MTRYGKTLCATGLLAVIGAVCVTPLAAKELTPRMGITVSSHSNVARKPSNEISDVAIRPYVGFEYEEEAAQFSADIDFQLDHEQYKDDTFDAQNFFRADAYMDWNLVPGRLSWVVEDYAYSQRIDIFDPNRPDNLQNFNVLLTGPDVLFSSGVYEALVKARLGSVYYSEFDADNLRFTASAIGRRLLNDYSEANADLQLTSVFFNKDFFDDYLLGKAAVGYKRELPYGDLLLKGGVNWVQHDSGVDASDPYGALKFKYVSQSGYHTLTTTLSSQYSDPALDAYNPLYTRLYDVGIDRVVNPNELVGTGAYKRDRAEVIYAINGSRLGMSVTGFANKRSYFILDDTDTRDKGVAYGISYRLNPLTYVWAGYYTASIDYLKTDLHLDARSPNVGLSYNLSDTLTLTVGVVSEENDSNDPEKEYKDDIYYVKLEYKGLKKQEEP